MNIVEITPDIFSSAHHLRVEYGQTVETFVVTHIGRFTYAVSIEHGYAYTRPQLIEKYQNVAATFTVEAKK